MVLIDFWTYTCINCIRTQPHLKAWDARYRKDGLTIIGVHSPEFPFEKDAGNVERAIKHGRARSTRSPRTTTCTTWNAFQQPVLAGRVPDRRARAPALRALRRGRLRATETRDPAAAARGGARRDAAGAREVEAITPDAVAGHVDAGDLPRRRARAGLRSRTRSRPGGRDFGALAAGDPAQDGFAYGGVWNVGPTRTRRRCTAPASRSASAPGGCTSCSGVRRGQALLDGQGSALLTARAAARSASTAQRQLYTLVDLPKVESPPPRAALRPTASRATPSRSAERRGTQVPNRACGAAAPARGGGTRAGSRTRPRGVRCRKPRWSR